MRHRQAVLYPSEHQQQQAQPAYPEKSGQRAVDGFHKGLPQHRAGDHEHHVGHAGIAYAQHFLRLQEDPDQGGKNRWYEGPSVAQ